jgi:hypothetical protein
MFTAVPPHVRQRTPPAELAALIPALRRGWVRSQVEDAFRKLRRSTSAVVS